ncbi:MAG: glutamine amidotransferase [Candidatus Uhrbacteria bacterium]|nr:glutamine amidotransferase [Patescibacteria group bacterium]MBU1907488.1 glutamine amidotransferase [Patescibacteria group bacterium]
MKQFLILQSRPEDAASDNELEALLEFGGLEPDQVHRVRMEQNGIPPLSLDDYSGIILGGGPYNMTDPEEKRDENQKRALKDLFALLDEVIEHDFPFLGACLGVGILSEHQKGKVSKEFSEDVGGVTIKTNPEGEADSLLTGLPTEFRAFVGHKEGCELLPPGAVLLASSDTCPVQMFRIKQNIYATQFHPELDVEGITLRINIYKHAGYFPPEDAEDLIASVSSEEISVPMMILKRFVDKYRRD